MLNFVGFSNNEINTIVSKGDNLYLRMIAEHEKVSKDEKSIELNRGNFILD